MKYKFVGLMVMTLILMFTCSQAGATEGNVIPAEAKDRIAEKYRLESPAPVSPDWSGMDVGISAPVDIWEGNQ